ncbi:O-methyltransferase [Thalassobacillus sp. C254]|uniref:O-methyltransferase n=1 Tax=Thalassobacillus sp. C254 TaxID=1225341 RepID=UPI0006D17300|nr:O-methyltransferase [Thalassobacillus sp. C254]
MNGETIEAYLLSLYPEQKDLLKEMEMTARQENIPIIDTISLEAVLQILRVHNASKVLEIGTAIGYSALRMAKGVKGLTVTTIERDEKRYNQAVEFIARSGAEDRITLVYGDALEERKKLEEMAPYDVLFIDAAKGQYKNFFTMYTPLLNNHGIIITDNVLFKGYVTDPEQSPKRMKTMVRKVKEYNEWLLNHPEYTTAILPVGDGIAVTTRKESW